jgi:hypothetical protein
MSNQLTARMNTHPHPDVMPPQFYGRPTFPLEWSELNWLQELPKDTYFALWARIPSILPRKLNLPLGHPLYVITFHQEMFDLDWIVEQSNRIDAPIVILNDGSCYNFPFKSNVHFFNYYSWHYHMETMMSWFPNKQPRPIKYKFSAVCNRITQAKLLVFTALMEYHHRDQLLVKLGNWLEEKNVHFRQPTGVDLLDQLSATFFEKYHGQLIDIDEFNDIADNYQRVNSNPWQPLYTESALHFTNESHHYSRMDTDEFGTIIYPGPQYSEKTHKCLVAGTPFIAVGQGHSYKYLRELGFKFDYGNIDLSWDNDFGNLSRLVSIVNLIKSLADYTIQDIVKMTKNSTDHNTEHLWSGKFGQQCRLHNEQTANQVISKFK